MKKFTDVISPASWLMILACFIQIYAVVFRPSLKDILIFVVADFISLMIFALLERRLFSMLFPSVKPYFPEVKREEIRKMNLTERKALLESFMNFPISRALFCFLMSYPKIIPAALVVTFVWKHESFSNFQQFILFFFVASVVLSYYYGVLFVELHSFVSDQIAKFHDEDNWTELFSSPPAIRKFFSFGFQERIVLVCIWIFVLSAQWVLLDSDVPAKNLVWQIAVINVSGILLVSRFLYLSRNYFNGGLLNLVNRLENFDPEKFQGVLPFHTSHILGQFEWVMNMLIYRLRDYRKQLSHWVLIRAEETRVTALGEISALVVHDLGTPLHVINFCASQIKETEKEPPNPKYIDQLVANVDRSVELVNSLRTYLRNGETTINGCYFFEAFTHAKQILRSQFGDRQFKKVNLEVDAKLKSGIRVNMAQADLIHVIHNLVANAFQDLLQTGREKPTVQISLDETEQNYITILLSDNGSGLSDDKFEKLTSNEYRVDAEINPRAGLGLRLIRALIERYKGQLSIINPLIDTGTTFRLRLPFEKEPALPNTSS